MKKLLVVFVLGCLLTTSYAQQDIKDHTIMFETLFGRHRVNSALGVTTDIAWILRYNNSTSAAVPYIYDKGLIELVSLNSIIFQVHKNIGISGGVNYHYRKGFMPSLGIHLSYSNPSLLLALTPCANFMPWANMEVNAVAEFKPVIVDDLRLLTRAQGCFGYDFSRQERERAKFYCRLGLMYKKVAAGFGINIDYYRPSAEPIDNYGLFIRLDI